MEFEASIGNEADGYLAVGISSEKVVVQRIRHRDFKWPFRRRERLVEPLFDREVKTGEEKEQVEAFLGKMLAYMKDAAERYSPENLVDTGTNWSFVMWAGEQVFSTGGCNAFPPWWDEACALISEVAGRPFGKVLPEQK